MRISDIFKKYMPDLTLADRVAIDNAFAAPSQFSHGGPETLRVANVAVSVSDGVTLYNPYTGKRSVFLDPDGDAFFGSNIDAPTETSFAIFSNTQEYNREEMGMGDVLLGDNSSGAANLQWDRSSGRLNFRIGDDVYVYVDTSGGVKVGANIILDGQAQVIRSADFQGGTKGFQIDAVTGDAEFNNLIARGEFRSTVFTYGEIQVTGGCQLVTPKATTVFEDFTVPSAVEGTVSAKLKNSNGVAVFVVNDIVRLKTYVGGSGKDSYLTVTAVGTNSGEYTTYTLKLKGGSTNWVASAGLAAAGWGTTSGGGLIQLRADYTDTPNLSLYTHAGAPWTDGHVLRGRMGNMYNTYGTGANHRFGFGVGDYAAGNYLSYNAETADTFVLSGGGGKVRITGGGLQVLTTDGLHAGENAVDWFPSWGGGLASSLWAAQTATYNHVTLEAMQVSGKPSTVYITSNTPSGYTSTIQLSAYRTGGDDATVRLQTGGGSAIIDMEADGVWIENGLKVGGTEGFAGPGNIYADQDIFTDEWTDYSSTSTITGWASYTTKNIHYKKVGKLVFVEFQLIGTGHASITTASFTLPYTSVSTNASSVVVRANNGSGYVAGLAGISGSTSQVNMYPTPAGGSWATGAAKGLEGQFWYEAA